MRDIQLKLRNPSSVTDKCLVSSKFTFDDRFLCDICEYAKARRKAVPGKLAKIDPNSEVDLKKNYLRPGASLSVEHFESRIKDRTLTLFGCRMSEQYVRGFVFVDHMS